MMHENSNNEIYLLACTCRSTSGTSGFTLCATTARNVQVDCIHGSTAKDDSRNARETIASARGAHDGHAPSREALTLAQLKDEKPKHAITRAQSCEYAPHACRTPMTHASLPTDVHVTARRAALTLALELRPRPAVVTPIGVRLALHWRAEHRYQQGGRADARARARACFGDALYARSSLSLNTGARVRAAHETLRLAVRDYCALRICDAAWPAQGRAARRGAARRACTTRTPR